MSQDYNNPAFKKLLVKLQEESWQLELIISGFAIFGLVSAYEPISSSLREASHDQQVYKFVLTLVAKISCAILIFNLLLHVLLRGLWIGTLGLRYVSGDIDYEKLNYSEKFTKYLKKKVGSFDKYIATLENYCSIIFAISFLLIFYVLAITLTIIMIAFTANYIVNSDWLPSWISKGFGIALILFIIFGMFFTFFDFVTQGYLKKKKWLSKIYFPIYWLFSFITLSFLYRPLVYNFLDNKFGKRLSFVLIPVYLGILLIMSLEHRNSNYLKKTSTIASIHLDERHYEDLLIKNNDFVRHASIQSKVIEDSYLKVFVVYTDRIENRIFKYESGLKPEKDIRGLGTDLNFTSGGGNIQINRKKQDSLTIRYLEVFNEIYAFKIDTTKIDGNFYISKNNKEQLGFETYLNIKHLEEGQHDLKITRNQKENDSIININTGVSIPFWYFKN